MRTRRSCATNASFSYSTTVATTALPAQCFAFGGDAYSFACVASAVPVTLAALWLALVALTMF